jgi:hypothetical protein
MKRLHAAGMASTVLPAINLLSGIEKSPMAAALDAWTLPVNNHVDLDGIRSRAVVSHTNG